MKWQAVIFNDSEQSIIMGCSYHQILGLLRVLKFNYCAIVYPDGRLEEYLTKTKFMDLVEELEDVEEDE